MPNETLRHRAERVYRYECMAHPLALELAKPDVSHLPNLTRAELAELVAQMAKALRVTLFDLAEQLDVLLDGQVKPE